MSRPFREKNKDLVNLRVVPASEVWVKDKNGKPVLNSKLKIFGRVSKDADCFVTTSNKLGENHKFKENTSNLTKKTQNEIVNLFMNKNRRVVYLVQKKSGTN